MRKFQNKGFVALISVVLLATGVMTFSSVTSSVALAYSDSIFRKELRIQAGLNTSSCLETLALMLAKDFFLNGPVSIPEFGCEAFVTNDRQNGKVKFETVGSIYGVRYFENREVQISEERVW